MNHDILKLSVELMRKCPVCGEKCTTSEGHVLESSEGHSVTYFQCDACKSAFMMHLVHYPFGVIGSVLLTDLALGEVRSFQSASVVNEDDVLEVHTELGNSNVEKFFLNR